MKILALNGPNLNWLGRRQSKLYGNKTLVEINDLLCRRAVELEVEVLAYQSNSEGALIDFIQEHSADVKGIIVNPGALTHYGLSLRDALAEIPVPIIEVHLSNIYAREEWRSKSVIAPIAAGQISGFGWRGYVAALEMLVAFIKGGEKR